MALSVGIILVTNYKVSSISSHVCKLAIELILVVLDGHLFLQMLNLARGEALHPFFALASAAIDEVQGSWSHEELTDLVPRHKLLVASYSRLKHYGSDDLFIFLCSLANRDVIDICKELVCFIALKVVILINVEPFEDSLNEAYPLLLVSVSQVLISLHVLIVHIGQQNIQQEEQPKA